MPIVDYKTYVRMLDNANKNKYAYPAINVSSMETANAALAGFAEAKSDGIIQVSTGGGEHASGTSVKDMVLGAISLANHVHLMAQKYNVTFTPEEKEKFALIENFGVPIENLKQIIEMKSSDRNKPCVQPGIPKDSLNNQLADWIQYSRRAAIDSHNKELSIAIKGDAKEEYPQIKKVMDILQKQKVNSFNLVTGLRGKDF